MKHSKKWFKPGRRIYRAATTCTCAECANVVKNGLVIYDKQHAEYLYMCQFDYPVDYFSKPLE